MKKGMLFFVFMLFFVIFISSVYAVSYGGEPCSYGRDCFISSDSQDYSVCLHGVCLLYSDGAYVECRINSHCGLDGLKVCKNYKCVLNQFCTRDSDCSSGYVCDSFVCKLSYDKSCSSDLECVSSLICDSASKKCRVGLNGYCNSTKKCAYPHFCENNKCITKSFGPGTCAKDSDCNSTSVCLNNKCVISANRTNFGSCKASENCAVNNYCINGLCSLNCASLGSSCGSSGKCSTQNFDNHSFISDGVVVYGPYYGSLCVQNKGVLNSVCSTNNDCSSGYVCDSFVCKLDKEQQCKSKSDCYFSYYCLQGVCVDLGFDAKVSNVSFVSGSEFENKNFVFKNGKTTVYVLASVVSDPVLNLNRFNISGVLSTNSVNSIGFGSFYSTDAFGDAIYSVNLDLSDDVLNSDKILFSAKKGDIVLYDASPISFTIGCSSDGDCSQFQNKPFCGSQEVCVQCKINSDCNSTSVCLNNKCVLDNNKGGSATGGSGGGSSSSTVYCSGLICSSNKECYWNSSSLGLSKSDFYVTEGIYCCAPWKNKGVSKDSGNAVCVGSAINPVTGGTSSLIEGACVDPDSDGIGTREDLMCPLGKVGSDCQKLAAVVCKIPPADLSVALSFYGFFSFMLTLLILVSFYIVKRKL